MKILAYIEALFILVLTCWVIILLAHPGNRNSDFGAGVIYIFEILVAIALGLALRRLRKLQKTITGILCNEKLMLAHWAAYLSYTLLDGAALITHLATNHKENYVADCRAIYSYILEATLIILGQFAWSLYLIITLFVIVKYGKPLEEDTRTLIINQIMKAERFRFDSVL